ncbi:MAG: Re/Si-specific NAD(P)(+) transhydrogenase subunit alpha [Lewinellaceae bacterium]|nr:Re/Si-specific NAD(P)(+) transhydrogenase subunit alpha [Lewinellaceae bacterium]
MKIGIVKESGDQRVALVPETISKLKALGVEVVFEKGAGAQSCYSDEDYQAVGAASLSRKDVFAQADLLITILPPDDTELDLLRKGSAVLSQFQPFIDGEVSNKLKSKELQGFSFDMIPRTTLAQSMDVLSSMASMAGYRAVLEAATHLPRYFPMMITAAGSIKPAKVLILGAGVAGLQAIATARRLGAMVEAFDTRQAAKEEVESLGAKFVEVEGAKDDKGAGGYAVQQSEEYLQRQRAEVQARAIKADVVITTAQVRGRKAPLLVPKETVEKMKPGAVIVDLASSTGGNCELTKDGEVISVHGVTIIGNSNLAGLMPQDASLLFSNNTLNFLKMLIKDGQINLDLGNEIIRGAFITGDSN